MIRYQLVSIDPLDATNERRVGGTYTWDVAQSIIRACYDNPACSRVVEARPVKIHRRRHTYYVEAAGRRWHLVADSPLQAAREAARRGVPARVWWCKDDYAAGCPPLAEQQRLAC